MRDETRLAKFLDQRGANYLIAFPAFYPELTGTLQAGLYKRRKICTRDW